MLTQLRWIGHAIGMTPYRLPRGLLYRTVQQGQRSVGGQKKYFSRQIKDRHNNTANKKFWLQPETLGVNGVQHASAGWTSFAPTTLVMPKTGMIANTQHLHLHRQM